MPNFATHDPPSPSTLNPACCITRAKMAALSSSDRLHERVASTLRTLTNVHAPSVLGPEDARQLAKERAALRLELGAAEQQASQARAEAWEQRERTAAQTRCRGAPYLPAGAQLVRLGCRPAERTAQVNWSAHPDFCAGWHSIERMERDSIRRGYNLTSEMILAR